MVNYQGGSDVSGGGFLSEPGLYHVVVTKISDRPTNKDGIPVDNGFFVVWFKVVASSVSGQESKEHKQVFFHSNPNHKDGGAFGQKILDRFFLAVGVLTPETIGQPVDFEWDDLVGRQLLIKIKKNKADYADIDASNMFHVDDPDASGYEKNDSYLKMIPARLRWKKGDKVPVAAAAKEKPVTTRPINDDDIPF